MPLLMRNGLIVQLVFPETVLAAAIDNDSHCHICPVEIKVDNEVSKNNNSLNGVEQTSIYVDTCALGIDK